MQDINAEKQYVIYSPNESATCFGAGFWNNEDGWTEFEGATLFTEAEARSLNLPTSVGNDARFVEKAAAWAAYCGNQDTQIARVRLTIDVAYELNEETAEDMRDFLERAAFRAIGNGMLSGDTSAVVDTYRMNVDVVLAAAENEETQRPSMRP